MWCLLRSGLCRLPPVWGLLPAALLAALPATGGEEVAPYTVVGSAIPQPLTATPGDPARGRGLVHGREAGNCALCHRLPEEAFYGDVGPDLGQVGRRLSAGELRLRVADASRLNPATVMPPYHRVAGLHRVAPPYQGRPVLTAQQVEDVVAYLTSLR